MNNQAEMLKLKNILGKSENGIEAWTQEQIKQKRGLVC
jgi:hypothetical protein